MTVEELAKSVAHQQGESWSDPDTLALFVEWVIEGIEEVVSEAAWPFLHFSVPLSVVADTAQYDLPATLASVTAVVDSATGRKLRYVPSDEQAARELDPNDTGEPVAWSFGPVDESNGTRSIVLWPTPTADLVLNVVGTRASVFSLTASDAFPLPTEFVRLVRNFVRAQYRENGDDAKGAELAWGRYRTGLAKLMNRYMDTPARWSKMQPRDISRVDAFGVPRLPDTIE